MAKQRKVADPEPRPIDTAEEAPFSLEKALARLDAIARELEGGGQDLEQSLERYREACQLHAQCTQRLTEAERELRILMADGSLTTGDPAQLSQGGAE